MDEDKYRSNQIEDKVIINCYGDKEISSAWNCVICLSDCVVHFLQKYLIIKSSILNQFWWKFEEFNEN